LKVGDESATQGEIDGFIQGLSPQAQKILATQGRRSFGDRYALTLVLYQDAVSHHLDSTAAFQRALAMARREILAQAAYQEIVRQTVVTPEEISKYFAAHQSEFEEVGVNEVVIRKKSEGADKTTPGLTAEEAKNRAEEIRKALSSGDDIKKVADKYQVPNVVRVDTEPSPARRGVMRPDMEKAAFELKEGQLSEVFDLPQYLVFFKVASHRVKELKDVSSQIENTLRQQKVNSAVDELKKNAKVWLDESYFTASSQPGPQGAAKPATISVEPVTPK
jgi:parvulin-like peptidyl-prolyl isomerase